jgi:hypothetical protein
VGMRQDVCRPSDYTSKGCGEAAKGDTSGRGIAWQMVCRKTAAVSREGTARRTSRGQKDPVGY